MRLARDLGASFPGSCVYLFSWWSAWVLRDLLNQRVQREISLTSGTTRTIGRNGVSLNAHGHDNVFEVFAVWQRDERRTVAI